jgi:phage gp36-like protein
MSYCTETHIKEMIDSHVIDGLIMDQHGVPDRGKVARAIQSGDSMIDGYLRVRYRVPLHPVPELIRKLSIDLAVQALFKRKASHFDIPEWVTSEANQAHKLLEEMREGKLDLGIEPLVPESPACIAQYEGPKRQFTAETLKWF